MKKAVTRENDNELLHNIVIICVDFWGNDDVKI